MKKVFSIFLIFFSLGIIFSSKAAIGDLDSIDSENVTGVSYTISNSGTDPLTGFQNLIFSLLQTTKIALSGVALLYIVYAGAIMTVSADDEESIKKSKLQLSYSILGFLFLNIPGQFYNIFFTDKQTTSLDLWQSVRWTFLGNNSSCTNIIFCPTTWENGAGIGIFKFMEIGLIGIAITILSYSAIKMIFTSGDDDVLTKTRERFTYWILVLISVGFLELFVHVASTSDLNLFTQGVSSLTRLLLLFTGPVIIFFLMVSGWMFLTAGGDEERIKKGKMILSNTFISVILLFAVYAFLNDILTF